MPRSLSTTAWPRRAADAINAKPFDRAKFETAIKSVYDTEFSGRTAMIPATAQVLEQFSSEEREMFLRMLRWQQNPDTKAGEAPGQTKAP